MVKLTLKWLNLSALVEHASDRVNFTLHLSNALTEGFDKMLKHYHSCTIHIYICRTEKKKKKKRRNQHNQLTLSM